MKQKIQNFIKKLKKSKAYGVARRHPRRTEFVAVNMFFGALASLFMGPILFHFGSAVHGFWGDGTGGLIWLSSLNLGPLGGFSDAVIYPYGDDLFRPELITAILFVLPFWLLANVIGPVAAWNAIIYVSFWLCGVSMYYLAKRVAKNRLAAVWAGVAFAYLPMHQYKAFGHIAYVMTFVFVFLLWQMLNFIEKPSKKNAVLLGLAFAVPFYIDGYYVLFALILVGVPSVFLLGKLFWQLSTRTVTDFKATLKAYLLFAATAVIALLPVIACKILYGAKISANLAMARGDFMSNVIVYTSRWYDYVVPIETHPVFGPWATAFRTSHNHGSNTSEHTLYLGFVLIGLVAWTVYLLWKRRKAKQLDVVPIRRQTLIILLLIAVVAFIVALPPFVRVFGHRIPLPSGVLSVFVQYWRVLARLVIIINLVLAVVGAVGLAVLLRRMRSRLAAIMLAVLLIAVTFFEYLSFNPFHRQDIWYYSKLSSANTWLANRQDIGVIAVYPLVDQPNGFAALYTTEQPVHGKKMINSGTISAKAARLRASISGLNDPQTLSVLKALGAQAVMTHEITDDRKVAGLSLAYGAHEAPAGYAADVDIFTIAGDIAPARHAVVADAGFKDVPDPALKNRHYFANQEVSLKLMAMPNVPVSNELRSMTLALHTTGEYQGNEVVVVQGGRVLEVLRPAAGEKLVKSYAVRVDEPVRFIVLGEMKASSLYLQDLRALD